MSRAVLSLTPLLDRVTIVKATGLDSWGETVAGERNVVPAKVKFVETDEKKQAVILLRGNEDIELIDVIEYRGNALQVVKLEYITDFAGNTINTKVTVK